ncbi:terpene synthase family protein [Streptomyces sp. I05A-00742]|uniref:terpene synthase family protein n=1 Tax=Streptomyces sp. I05A-00742 TaxID=2732853 RepID=UPI001489373F|nr:terpene synthase family protein [Streptomyces sp. I05A-00742]
MDPYDFTIPAGTVFRIPEIRTSLPEACHPRCAELDERAHTFSRPYLVDYFGDEDRADRFLAQGHAHYACLGYPHVLEDRAQAVANSILPATLLDDTFSKPGLQGNLTALKEHHAQWSAVFAGERPPPEADAAYHFVYDSIEACAPYASTAVARRLRDGWQDAADAFLDEAVHRHHNHTTDLAAYAERRVRVHFRTWACALLEFSLGIDLGPLADHPLVRSAQHYAIWHLALANDCYSLVKELSAHEATNTIIELMRHDRLDLQTAVDKVAGLVHRTERDYVRVRDEIRSTFGDRSDVAAYADGLGFFITGNLRIMQSSSRYHGLDHDGSRVLPGPVTITYMPTVHTPRGEFPC